MRPRSQTLQDHKTVANQSPIRILIIDDSEADQLVTRTILGQIPTLECEVDWVATYEEGLTTLAKNEHDLLIVDFFLNDSHSGLELISEARDQGINAPTIMLTGRGSREVDLEAMSRGAFDYLKKGEIDPDTLDRSVRYALERARQERELRASEARHRGMFDHLPVGIYWADLRGESVEANPALVEMLGYPNRELLQEKYARHLFVNPLDRARFWAMLEEHGVARGFESQIEPRGGTPIRVRNTARLHRGPEGEPRYIEGAVEDITDLHRSEHLRRMEARFRVLFEMVSAGIVLVDPDGLIAGVNPVLEDALLTTRATLEGTPFLDLVAPEERPQMAADLEGLFDGTLQRIAGERRLVDLEGREGWSRVVGSLVRGPEGNPDQVILLLEQLSLGG